MLHKKEETLRLLEFEANRLHRIQILVQEGETSTRLLLEINLAKKALDSVRNGFLKNSLINSLSVLQDSRDIDTQMNEIRKISELFSEAPNF